MRFSRKKKKKHKIECTLFRLDILKNIYIYCRAIYVFVYLLYSDTNCANHAIHIYYIFLFCFHMQHDRNSAIVTMSQFNFCFVFVTRFSMQTEILGYVFVQSQNNNSSTLLFPRDIIIKLNIKMGN